MVMFHFFAFWPFLIPVLIILFFARVIPGLFRGFFREIEERRFYRDQGIPRHRKQGEKRRQIRNGKPRNIDGVIFNLAYTLKGEITLSDIIIETGLSMKEAEKTIDQMVDGIRVRMEVDDQGLVVYEFPEIIARQQKDTDREH
jgi:hypothetical protein